MEIICDKNLCTGCGTCNDVCPKSAIAMKLDGEGFLYPVIDQSLCIDCKLCTKTCPINHPVCVRANELCDVDVHEGWALNEDIRKKSSSGGIFGQLAFDLLNTEEWKVAGVAFNGKRAFHKLISKIDDLELLQNTKYVQSDTSAIYHDVLIELSHGMNILFSGTPCQVAGCYSFLKGKSYSGKLLTIEVVCHGVPSYFVLDKSIEYNNAKKVISFRNKSQGWGYCSQQITYGTKCSELTPIPREKDLFYRFFFSEKVLRKSCYQCPFARFPRVADITIGDSWGTTNPSKEERWKGLSLVIANNKEAYNLLNKVKNIHLREIGWFTEIQINRNLYTSFPPFAYIEERKDGHYIQNKVTSLDCGKFLNETKLGYLEKKLMDSLIRKVVRKVCNKVFFRVASDGDLRKMSYIRLRIILATIIMRGKTSLLPSEHELAKKFADITEQIYAAKHNYKTFINRFK